MEILFYSKFVFADPPERPSQAPRQDVGTHIERQGQRAQQHVEQVRHAAESLKQKKEGLLKYWQNNNPKGKIEVVEDDPKAVVFHEIKNPLRAKEAYLLMSLIEDKWQDMGGLDLAMSLYKKAKAGRKKAYDIDFKPFEHFFRKGNHAGNATERLGFYFWEDKNEWYAYDTDKGSDDKSCGSTYLVKSLPKIRSEFADKSNKDSGLIVEDEQHVLELLKNGTKEADAYYKERYVGKGKSTLKWFQSNAENKWVPLDSKTAKTMNILFGAGVGKYLYRFDAEQKRVYFIRLQGASLAASEGESGYIEINDGKLGKWVWHHDIADLKKNLLDKMSAESVVQEYIREKTKAGEEVQESQAVEATKKTLIRIHKTRKVKYSKLGSEYADKLEKELKKELRTKEGYDEAKAEKVAQAAIVALKRKIEKKINDDPELKKGKEDDPVLEITLDNNGEPKVEFRNSTLRAKIRKKLEKAKKVAAGTDLDKLIDQKTSAITKHLGPLGMFLKFFGVDLKKDVADYYKTGKKSIALWLVMSISSVEIGRRVLRGKGIGNVKDLEKLAKKNKGVLSKDQLIKKDLTPKGYKITIPKGKGILPGGTFTANGEIISPKKEDKKKGKKKKFTLFGFLGGSKKSSSKFVMEDTQIIITQNDKIPKGTVLPKGAKIEKI